MKLAALIGTAALAIAAGTAPAQPAVQILDRTFVCTTEYDSAKVMASPKGDLAFATARTTSSGYLGVGSGAVSALSGLVYVRARAELGFSQRAPWPQGVYARAGKCFLSRKTAPLSSTGLVGPPVLWAKSYDCIVRGRLVVRVRAVLSQAATWRRIDDAYFGARTNVVSAQLAVRSEKTGKPVGYATLDSGGKTKLWVKSGCA